MTNLTLERRLKTLELQVSQLQEELRSVQDKNTKDWRTTIGAFTDDEGLKEVLQGAMRLREADRSRIRGHH